jgi:hypothetical protein
MALLVLSIQYFLDEDGYLNRLERRMEACGFLPDDRLLVWVLEARDAMHELTVAMHYTGCRGQVGRDGGLYDAWLWNARNTIPIAPATAIVPSNTSVADVKTRRC